MNTEIVGSIDRLCKVIGASLGRPVIDKTGIAGGFDLRLEFALDESVGEHPSDDTMAAPSIFTALQQQLGLKLESTKGPGEILIIDSVEKPSAN